MALGAFAAEHPPELLFELVGAEELGVSAFKSARVRSARS